MFNPVLAFSVQFPCSGHTYLEYCFIYWLGPLLGKEPEKCCLLLPFVSCPNLNQDTRVRFEVTANIRSLHC